MLIRIRQNMKSQKGFTLIELLMVIAVIGVLVAIAIPRLGSATETARGAKIKADLRSIDTAITVAIANGSFTSKSGTGTGALPTSITDQFAVAPVPPAGAYQVGTTSYTAATGYSVNATDRAVVDGGTGAGKTAEGL